MSVVTRGGRTAMPRLVYGTAWKAEATADLVYTAIRSGFRGVDTAAQPRHYREDLVGAGVRRAISEGIVSRSDLYLQTKFTPIGGQDPDNLPYDPKAPLAEQVKSSVESSLKNFTFGSSDSYIDCLVLHSPLPRPEDTRTVWAAMQAYVPDKVRTLGVSNMSLEHLELLSQVPEPGPVVVQNRFHRATGYDVAVRRYCADAARRIVYQSFWTLTANPKLARRACVKNVATLAGVDLAVAFYAMVALGLSEGDAGCPMVVLDGTKTEAHMTGDLAGLEKVAAWAAENKQPWEESMAEFKALIGEE